MIGSDAFICTMLDGVPTVYDLTLKSKYSPDIDSQNKGQHNVYITAGSASKDGITYTVRRPLISPDSSDYVIKEDVEIDIIWALGETYDLYYHGMNRGTKKVMPLFNKNFSE